MGSNMTDNDAVYIPAPEALEDAYTKVFKMQATGADGQTIRVSVPREVVRREAKRHDMTIQVFLKHFKVEWRFNSFPGFYGCFVPISTTTPDSINTNLGIP